MRYAGTAPARVGFVSFCAEAWVVNHQSDSVSVIDPSFDRSMILFHDIVQVRTGATATTMAQFALLLQFCNDFGVGGVAVDVDHPRARVTGST